MTLARRKAATSAYDSLPRGGNGRLNYQDFVDVYVDTNGNRKEAIVAAGYTGDDFAGNAQAILKKPEVKKAIAERAASQFFAQLPLGVKVIEDILGLEHTDTYTDKDGKQRKVVNMNALNLKAKVALKMLELAQVKELAAANLAVKASQQRVDLNDLAQRLAGLVSAGDLPTGFSSQFESTGADGASGIDEYGGTPEEDDESSLVYPVR